MKKDEKTRKCTNCQKFLPLNGDYFYKTKSPTFFGFMWRCKKCDNAQCALRKDPKKVKTRTLTHYAIKTGKLLKESCKVCGKVEVEGHHPDYDKPLEIIWLCRKHHQLKHYELRQALP